MVLLSSVILGPHAGHHHQGGHGTNHGASKGSHRSRPFRQHVGQISRSNGGRIADNHGIAHEQFVLVGHVLVQGFLVLMMMSRRGIRLASLFAKFGIQPRFKDALQQVNGETSNHATGNDTPVVGVLLEAVDEDFENAINHGGPLASDLVDPGPRDGRQDAARAKAQAVEPSDGEAIVIVELVQVRALQSIRQVNDQNHGQVGKAKPSKTGFGIVDHRQSFFVNVQRVGFDAAAAARTRGGGLGNFTIIFHIAHAARILRIGRDFSSARRRRRG
mmetsp:Transcript_17143/g.37410  ORF Transcript_17143/g.37410 Transcript_17143/m.37410 type:complete len:274 (-) Transcript_17143:600-1421(-)